MRCWRNFKMKITLNPNAKDPTTRDALVAEGGFGKYYTDHMVICEWTQDGGWAEPELIPYGPLSLDPATAVLHYGQEIFEGMKAIANQMVALHYFAQKQMLAALQNLQSV